MYDPAAIKNADQVQLDTQHHFSGGVYAKQMFLPAGHVALSHSHRYDHMSILAQGECLVVTPQGSTRYQAPAVIEIKAGLEHQVEAIQNVVWFCIHATGETDPDKVDEVLIV